VILCYFFVDKPVAFFVYRHGIAQTPTIKWFTEPPPMVQGWSPLLVAAYAATLVRFEHEKLAGAAGK
jgi:hypothetical protein